MPDTFDHRYSWLRTWKENPSPPILFYGTSSNLISKIMERGLTPTTEEENSPIAIAQHILSLARKLGDKRTAEQAELILLEHEEKPSASGELRLTFNYHRALQLARKRTRRIEALQWLCETFKERAGQREDKTLVELTINRVNYPCNGMCDVHLNSHGVIIYVCTDLSKFRNLSPMLENKKELKRALKGKGNHWPPRPKRTLWGKPVQSELEAYLEKSIRGDKDHPGLGEEVSTVHPIPPSEIVRIELPSDTSAE